MPTLYAWISCTTQSMATWQYMNHEYIDPALLLVLGVYTFTLLCLRLHHLWFVCLFCLRCAGHDHQHIGFLRPLLQASIETFIAVLSARLQQDCLYPCSPHPAGLLRLNQPRKHRKCATPPTPPDPRTHPASTNHALAFDENLNRLLGQEKQYSNTQESSCSLHRGILFTRDVLHGDIIASSDLVGAHTLPVTPCLKILFPNHPSSRLRCGHHWAFSPTCHQFARGLRGLRQKSIRASCHVFCFPSEGSPIGCQQRADMVSTNASPCPPDLLFSLSSSAYIHIALLTSIAIEILLTVYRQRSFRYSRGGIFRRQEA